MSEDSKLKSGDVANTDIYNVEAAEILANEALLLPLYEAVPIYEQLLSTFPTSAKFWKQYVEAYMTINNDEATKQIFSRRCYIRFIRKVNDKKGSEGLEETRKAFDFMLSYVGSDISAGPVWMEYITFLKSMPVVTAQEESQRMISVRKIYQKAIVTPNHHIEQLWKDYENFENSINRALAKGLLSEYQPKYNSARAVYRERKKYIDEIDWNMLAEEQQCIAWKRLLAFEKANPQRIDSASSNRRITFTYEQCMMFMYHYPDIWYDYATWLSKNTSLDSAAKVFQRALKALPDSAPLKYAYAELEESRGAIQFIKFLRRTEGIEVARKYFLDAQKLSNCTYHVFVAYAMMAFCLDKDLAHNVFEAGLKKFMNEPGYILEYADFLCRLNDDRNVRALFERALSLLPPENSEEVWKQFAKFEQTYGDLASILKAKEALSGAGEEDSSALESTLHDVVSRYNFMDLWPCSSKELDHLARQEWLARTIDKKADKSFLLSGTNALDKVSMGQVSKVYSQSAKIIYPDTSRMVIYDPRQTSELPTFSNSIGSGNYKRADDILKSVSPALAAFITNLPAVEGPYPDVDVVLSILLQYSTPAGTTGKTYSNQQAVACAGPSTSDLSGSSKTRLNPNGSSRRYPREGHSAIRKDIDRQEDDEVTTVQSRPLPRDLFRIRQIQKSRGATASQTGSAASAGSAFSGDQSISTD
ncbi:hypothetical protein IEQ34_002418 [Dendrobium chrysotoxum]|uniref:Suppressor of forked domain-containing protein n=1 Tax=Dendrobium chrysotoxum TaxID=161865 RepID=A0AAV7HJD4_DENCH|nr:hypothetical protein IEQ34_002418 [Dendrobium chrysotoxum]